MHAGHWFAIVVAFTMFMGLIVLPALQEDSESLWTMLKEGWGS